MNQLKKLITLCFKNDIYLTSILIKLDNSHILKIMKNKSIWFILSHKNCKEYCKFKDQIYNNNTISSYSTTSQECNIIESNEYAYTKVLNHLQKKCLHIL